MRLSKTCVCSTAHLTAYERAAFDKLIASSPQRDGRILVDHVSLSVEPHQFGFAVRLGVVNNSPMRPEDVSATFWHLLLHAKSRGADWLSFDRDEEPSSQFPIYRDGRLSEGETGRLAREPSGPAAWSQRCPGCGTDDVICDASARWDEETGSLTLIEVFDAGWCETCERDVDQSGSSPAPGGGSATDV